MIIIMITGGEGVPAVLAAVVNTLKLKLLKYCLLVWNNNDTVDFSMVNLL